MKSMRFLAVLLSIGLLAVGCSQEPDMTAPETQNSYNLDKNGTETLGPPTIDIASGSCFAQGGIGMVEPTTGILEINVPDGTINQVLLYWAGGTTGADGDNVIMIDGNEVTGELIGGETEFFQVSGVSYYFWAYRADITDLNLVTNGDNAFQITEFDFDYTGGSLDENDGIGMMVIYDDGTEADIQVLDGLDLAFFDFEDPLDHTVPQTFTFDAYSVDRMARMVIFSGSVGFERPNQILFTTSAGVDLRENPLGSPGDGPLWDTLCLTDILIPAGDTAVTVELVSTPVQNPLGASMAWVGAGLSLPTPTYCIGDLVWYDANRDGCQDPDELPAEGIEVILYEGCEDGAMITSTFTTAEGYYAFCDLLPGDYQVQFVAPEGYYFCAQYASACGPENDSNAGEDGMTDCITVVDADDWTIDAALCEPEPETACLGDRVWEDVNMNGIQDDGELGFPNVVVHLYDCQDNQLNQTVTDSDGLYMFCDLDAGTYMVKFLPPAGYEFSPQDQGADDTVDSDADPMSGMTTCITLDWGDHDMTWDAGVFMPPTEEIGCRMTGGGNDEFTLESGDINVYRFGGQAGAPLASQPQPWGNWTHTQKNGPAGSFTFHAGTASAPPGTEIDWITCMDPDWCVQARQAPAKQLDFAGVGTFKNMRNAPDEIADFVTVHESLHWFEVNIDDLGEPGGHDLPDGCDPLGFGRNGGTELADCDCPDFYRIRIYQGMDDGSPIMYEVYGYIDGGNFQLHPPTGRDQGNWN